MSKSCATCNVFVWFTKICNLLLYNFTNAQTFALLKSEPLRFGLRQNDCVVSRFVQKGRDSLLEPKHWTFITNRKISAIESTVTFILKELSKKPKPVRKIPAGFWIAWIIAYKRKRVCGYVFCNTPHHTSLHALKPPWKAVYTPTHPFSRLLYYNTQFNPVWIQSILSVSSVSIGLFCKGYFKG